MIFFSRKQNPLNSVYRADDEEHFEAIYLFMEPY